MVSKDEEQTEATEEAEEEYGYSFITDKDSLVFDTDVAISSSVSVSLGFPLESLDKDTDILG